MLQALYEMHVQLHIDGSGMSATTVQRFGIRSIRSVIDHTENGHVFFVNGCKACQSTLTSCRFKICPFDLSVVVSPSVPLLQDPSSMTLSVTAVLLCLPAQRPHGISHAPHSPVLSCPGLLSLVRDSGNGMCACMLTVEYACPGLRPRWQLHCGRRHDESNRSAAAAGGNEAGQAFTTNATWCKCTAQLTPAMRPHWD